MPPALASRHFNLMSQLAGDIPTLTRGVRFRRLDPGRGVLLAAVGMVKLDATGCAVIESIDGARSAGRIASTIAIRFKGLKEASVDDVIKLLERLAQRGLVFFSRGRTG
jgi:hypothetical protein